MKTPLSFTKTGVKSFPNIRWVLKKSNNMVKGSGFRVTVQGLKKP
jgi:hypothetical protein